MSMRMEALSLLAVVILVVLTGIPPLSSAPYRPVIVEQRVYGYMGPQTLVAVAEGYAVGVTGSSPYDSFFVLDTGTGDADIVSLGASFYLCGVAYDDAENTVFLSLLVTMEKENKTMLIVIRGPGSFEAYSLPGTTSCMALGVSSASIFLASTRSSAEETRVSLVVLDRESMEASAFSYVIPYARLRLDGLYVLKDTPIIALSGGNGIALLFSPLEKTVYAYNVTRSPRMLAVTDTAALMVNGNYTSLYILENIYSPEEARVYEYDLPLPSVGLSAFGIITGDYAVTAVSCEKDTVIATISLSSKHASYTWLSGGLRVASIEAQGKDIVLGGSGVEVSLSSSTIVGAPKPRVASSIDIHRPVEEPVQAPELVPEKLTSSAVVFKNGSVDDMDAVMLTVDVVALRNMIVIYPYDYMLIPFSEKASTAYIVLRVDDQLFNVTLSMENNSFVVRGVPAGDVEADVWMMERGVGEPYYMGSIEVKGYDGAYYSTRFIRQTPYIINASMDREKNIVEAILVNPGQGAWNTVIHAYIDGKSIYNQSVTIKPVSRRTISIPYSDNGTMRIKVYVVKNNAELLTHIYMINVTTKHEAPSQPHQGPVSNATTGPAGGSQTSQAGGGTPGEATSGGGEGAPILLYLGLAAAVAAVAAAAYFLIIRHR